MNTIMNKKMDKRSARLLPITFAFFLSVAVVVCATSCSTDNVANDDADDVTDNEVRGKPWSVHHPQPYAEFLGVRVVIEDASSHGATARIVNTHGYDILLEPNFTVFAMNGNEVIGRVPFVDGIMFTLARPIPSPDQYLQNRYIDFDFYYGGLKPGQYRYQISEVHISDDLNTPLYAKKPLDDFEIVILYVSTWEEPDISIPHNSADRFCPILCTESEIIPLG